MNISDPVRRDRAISLGVAVAIHAVVFAGGTFWISPVEYGVEAGDGGIEVHLIAALPAASAGKSAVSASAQLPPLIDPLAQPMPQPQAELPAENTAQLDKTEAPIANPTPYVGDGSSLVPGKDATTFHSSGGARTNSSPGYFRNPAPAYPAAARENGYEGTVVLRAEVMPSGRCSQLTIVQSSGYSILDEAAAQAIRRWRFKPARRAGAAITAWVEIPVRFNLVDSGES